MRANHPASAKVGDDGAGGISVAADDFQLTVTQGDLRLPDIKAGAKSAMDGAAPESKAKITFVTHAPEDLAWVTEMTVRGRCFTATASPRYLTVAGKKLGCIAVELDEARIAAAKAACKSLTKK